MIIKKAKGKRKIRTKTRGTKARPRLSVFRSNKAIYAQVIDDVAGKTLVAASEKELTKKLKNQKTKESKNKKTKTEKAELVGRLLARKALKKSIKTVVFDRRDYQYHGRVKALAEGARKKGLKF